jgi:adenylate kinase
MYVILLGAPGAGKGTQAAILVDELRLPHVSSGDLFRSNLEGRTEMGLLAKSYMEEGKLVPDEVTIRMILERIAEVDCVSGCLFDGFPRTLEQASALDAAMLKQNRKIDMAVYIRVPEEELVKRLSGRWICSGCLLPYHNVASPPKVSGKCDKCGGELYQRTDDKEEVVRERLKVFFNQTMPVLDYYREQDKLIEVDGNGEISKIAEEMLAAIRSKSSH